MRKCFVLAFCVLTLAACKKKPSDVDVESSCENVTYYYNDTIVALVTQVSTPSTDIIKIENGAQTTVASASGYEFWGPVISPDKQRFICFRSTKSGNTIKVDDYENAELWMFDIDGSNGHVITTKTAQGWRAMGMADWAPDGKHIVLAAEKNEPTDGNNPHWSIFLTDTTGMTAIKMNTRHGRFTHPRFANGNMNYITYSALPVGTTTGDRFRCEIFYAGVDGSYQLTGEYRITNDLMADYSPSWSPDNSMISFCKTTSMAERTAITLHTFSVSSGSVSTLINDNSFNENPYWCPTNGQIYYTNKSGAYCFSNIKRVEAGGTNNMSYYRISNADYYQINLK